jgi:tetratricopeptide (TPR) repeat protein
LDEMGRDLLKRMCVLRVGIDVRGLTFLRLFTESEDKDDSRFSLAVAIEEPAELTDEEILETQLLIDQLISCSLIQNVYDEKLCEDFYGLHRLVVEFLQTEFQSELPDLLQRVYSFYCTGKTIENPKTLEDLRPLLEAQHFAFQIGSHDESISLVHELNNYLKPWGYWTLLHILAEQVFPHAKETNYRIFCQILGGIYCDWGDWQKAEEYFNLSLTNAEKANSKSGMAASWGFLGDIERNRGNWAEAERLFRQYQQMCEELGDRSGMATSWGLLGDIERNRGNWDEAERLKRRSLALREELGDRSGMATSWGSLGDIERNRGNWDEAERLYRRSLELREELGDRSGMAYSIGSLGEIELERGNLETAEEFLQDALQRFEELGDRQLIGEVHYRLMQLELKRHNPDRAQQHYAIAHQLYTQLGAAKDLEKIEQEWNAM